jgi:filamentous hemagglutinin
VGISTGGNIGSQFVGNMANSLLVGVNGKGSDSSTTKSAVSDGNIIIRDGDQQTQNVADLSRDVEHANQTLSPIFDKEKEQRRLQEAQKIGEIGSQVMDIARTQGDINGLNAAKKELGPLKENATEKERQAYVDRLRNSNAYKEEMKKSGTGSALQQGLSAATAAVQGLAGGDMAKAIAGGAAPYLAEVIHNMTTDPVTGKVNTEANLMAHAVVGAVVAQINGNSALAGASGAATGEFIAQQLYPTIKREDLTEEQRQTISSLSTLAAGLAGGLTGDSSANAVAGAQAGKTAAENNNLAVIRTGAAACAEIAACSKAVIDLGLGALIGVGVATSAMEDLSNSQKTNVMLAAMSGDQNLIDNLSPSERAAYEEWKGNQGLITVFPAGEKDPTGGKLVNPAQEENKGTSLVTPDQSGGQKGKITITPESQSGKNDGVYINPRPAQSDTKGTTYISESGEEINAGSFFDGTKYTDKVKQQASSGDYHSFPESVDGHSDQGTVTEITGGDGIKRWKLEISGSYRGNDGVFEYIRNPDGSINHRLFIPNENK